MKSLIQKTLLIAMGMAVASSPAMAAFTFTNGDLILGFQATGGQGSTQNVFFNLGSGTSFRDGTNPTSLGNVSATLSLVFGNNWYDRSDVVFGVIGNLTSNPTTGIGSAGAVNGDPSRTVYVSRDTATPGGSLLWTGYTTNALGVAGSSLTGMEGMIVGLTTELDNAAILTQATQATAWNNGWTTYNPNGGGGFNTFNGGIQQNFGETGDTTFIDIQRILATNTGATLPGAVGTGTTIATIGIGRDGGITAVPEASSSLLIAVAGAAGILRRRRSQAA